MISDKVQKLLNEQIMKELFSAYLYLSMEAYYASINLAGFANWFHVQAQEEKDHAMLIFNYINKAGGRVTLLPIDAPQTDFTSIQEALDLTFEHEKLVTKSIYTIVDAAAEERDHKTSAFLQWFVNEQVEEEDNAQTNARKFSLVKDDGRGILMLDAEFAARVYVPTTTTAQA